MKKIIALLLALVMAFSMGTVAFAEGEEGTAPETSETTPPAEDETADDEQGTTEDETTGDETVDSLLGEYDWILDLPFATVKPALKIAKIALKLGKVYIKLGLIFGFVDKDALVDQVAGIIEGLIGGATEESPEGADDSGDEALKFIIGELI